jgi:uncharacterized OB-fold protein
MPIPDYPPPEDGELAREFWSGVEAGELRLPKCTACGAWQWYPQETGPHCDGASLAWVTLPGTGTVFTHTTVRHPFLPNVSAEDLPFAVVIVEPDGAPGVRLVGDLAEDAVPAVGMRVAMAVVHVRDRVHPVFRPMEG